MTEYKTDFIFNSPLETGIRSISILSIDLSLQLDLQQLLAFDHLVVHTGDIQTGPASLHPKVTDRNGELLIRRTIVEKGLLLMESKMLVKKNITPQGFYYSATELALSLLENISNEYMAELHKRSIWAVEKYRHFGNSFFAEIFNSAFDRWTQEFQIGEVAVGKKGTY